MNVQRTTKNKGFTIIEVVLVLAIAGLIFLMVFIALPALQRNQRDTARKNDASTIASAVTTYVSNNRGSFPTTSQLQSYIKEKSDNTVRVIVNGTTGDQTLPAATGTATATTTAQAVQDGLAVVTQKSVCGTSAATQVLTVGAARQFTVTTKIEAASGVAFCQNS